MISPTDHGYIRLQDLTYVYSEGGRTHKVLDALNIEIARGEAVALLGRSGSGKSTLLNLLGGIDEPTEGAVWLNSTNVSALAEPQRTLFRRRHIGFVYQFFNLIPTLSVRENLLLPLELNGWRQDRAGTRVRGLLQEVGLWDRCDSFPDQLSGGEQQRLAIIRALVHEPDLVLADEPTGNLDAQSGQVVLELLDRLVRNEGRTLLLVTHSRAVASHADRILSLNAGKLEASIGDFLW